MERLVITRLPTVSLRAHGLGQVLTKEALSGYISQYLFHALVNSATEEVYVKALVLDAYAAYIEEEVVDLDLAFPITTVVDMEVWEVSHFIHMLYRDVKYLYNNVARSNKGLRLTGLWIDCPDTVTFGFR